MHAIFSHYLLVIYQPTSRRQLESLIMALADRSQKSSLMKLISIVRKFVQQQLKVRIITQRVEIRIHPQAIRRQCG